MIITLRHIETCHIFVFMPSIVELICWPTPPKKWVLLNINVQPFFVVLLNRVSVNGQVFEEQKKACQVYALQSLTARP